MSDGGGDFLKFAAEAQPGDRRSYGRGEHPPREAVRAMAPLVAAGVLSPVAKREGGQFLFMVERTRTPLLPGRARSSRGRVRRRKPSKNALSIVFDCLARAARRCGPCPTNEELASLCGLSDKLQASYRIRQLVALGRIAIEDRHPWGRRIVTILAGPHAGSRTCEAAL